MIKLSLDKGYAGKFLREQFNQEKEKILKAYAGVQGEAPVTDTGSPLKALGKALQDAGEIIRKAVVEEAKKGFIRLEYKPAAWKHLVELKVRVIGGHSVEVYGHIFFDDSWIEKKEERDREMIRRKATKKRTSRKETMGLTSERDKKTGPGAMDKSRGMTRPGREEVPGKTKKYGIFTKEGIVILKSMPMKTDELWIHPIMAKNGFVQRGVRKAWPRAWAVLRKALKKK